MSDNPKSHHEYVVVARRYRPRSFSDLVGQEHIAQALSNAIVTQRVGHAYLFTGARGVGKTSTARIFAKALNAPGGPTPDPDNDSDICRSIDAGEDIDVLEIDGASNRGIDEIRQLRSNVNIRPSRARFKIYMIDEVHMLTTAAFNALLKTLEEPPEHVKFILCTTDPEKIPITVLSRCQRFDFSPVGVEAIAGRLVDILEAEGLQADDEAVRLLARRASGSMRDSQSLLEQLLSFCSERITVDDVHRLMGTAPGGRLSRIASLLIDHQVAEALVELDQAVAEGVDVGQLAEQLLGFFRDLMAVIVGCEDDLLIHCSTADHAELRQRAESIGLETVLAILQILDQSLVRMRQSTQVRTMMEVAMVRIGRLEDLDAIGAMIQRLESGSASSGSDPPPATRPAARPRAEKKTAEIDSVSVQESHTEADLSDDTAVAKWQQALANMGDMTSEMARYAAAVAISAPNCLVVSFNAEYTLQKESCERSDRKVRLEQALSDVMGRPMRLDFQLSAVPAAKTPATRPVRTRRQSVLETERHPLVRSLVEMFDAEVVRVEPPRNKNHGTESS